MTTNFRHANLTAPYDTFLTDTDELDAVRDLAAGDFDAVAWLDERLALVYDRLALVYDQPADEYLISVRIACSVLSTYVDAAQAMVLQYGREEEA